MTFTATYTKTLHQEIPITAENYTDAYFQAEKACPEGYKLEDVVKAEDSELPAANVDDNSENL